jgi:TATA-binding protein-associated factor
MSDPDEQVRLLSTSTFAALVKMVPLEAGIPDPPGFSLELLAKRDEERKFLMQLLDGSKAEQYQVPIEIKADLRQYQKDGVSWLAFLAKYQLHGILCDGTSALSLLEGEMLMNRYGPWKEFTVHLYHRIETS